MILNEKCKQIKIFTKRQKLENTNLKIQNILKQIILLKTKIK